MARTVKLLFGWGSSDSAVPAHAQEATQLPPVSRSASDQRAPAARMLTATASAASA